MFVLDIYQINRKLQNPTSTRYQSEFIEINGHLKIDQSIPPTTPCTRRNPNSISKNHRTPVKSSDNPEIPLVTCLLNKDNHLTWARVIRNTLKANNKLMFC